MVGNALITDVKSVICPLPLNKMVIIEKSLAFLNPEHRNFFITEILKLRAADENISAHMNAIQVFQQHVQSKLALKDIKKLGMDEEVKFFTHYL
jgi:hypothetical protein